MTSNKYKFTITNINLEKISKKFNIVISLNNKTLLTELDDTTVETISFLDETKRLHNCSNISKFDLVIKTGKVDTKNNRLSFVFIYCSSRTTNFTF